MFKNIELSLPFKMDKIQILMYITIILFVVIFAYNRLVPNKNTCSKEGMTAGELFFVDKFKTYSKVEDIYNSYYASIYDQLFLDKNRLKMELDQAAYYSKINKKSIVLDIGPGVGHHMRVFHELAGETKGLDKSKDMIKKAKKNYPYLQIDYGDAMDTMTYPEGSFTHITMFYFTIYYFQDKYGILSNVHRWLRKGGYFIVHLVNRKMFDPVVGLSNPFMMVNPQKYAKKRITKSKVIFNDMEFSSDFTLDEKKDMATFEEKMRHRPTNHIVQNNHTIYMPSLKSIVVQAERLGMEVVKVIDLEKVQYEYNYIYIFKKK